MAPPGAPPVLSAVPAPGFAALFPWTLPGAGAPFAGPFPGVTVFSLAPQTRIGGAAGWMAPAWARPSADFTAQMTGAADADPATGFPVMIWTGVIQAAGEGGEPPAAGAGSNPPPGAAGASGGAGGGARRPPRLLDAVLEARALVASARTEVQLPLPQGGQKTAVDYERDAARTESWALERTRALERLGGRYHHNYEEWDGVVLQRDGYFLGAFAWYRDAARMYVDEGLPADARRAHVSAAAAALAVAQYTSPSVYDGEDRIFGLIIAAASHLRAAGDLPLQESGAGDTVAQAIAILSDALQPRIQRISSQQRVDLAQQFHIAAGPDAAAFSVGEGSHNQIRLPGSTGRDLFTIRWEPDTSSLRSVEDRPANYHLDGRWVIVPARDVTLVTRHARTPFAPGSDVVVDRTESMFGTYIETGDGQIVSVNYNERHMLLGVLASGDDVREAGGLGAGWRYISGVRGGRFSLVSQHMTPITSTLWRPSSDTVSLDVDAAAGDSIPQGPDDALFEFRQGVISRVGLDGTLEAIAGGDRVPIGGGVTVAFSDLGGHTVTAIEVDRVNIQQPAAGQGRIEALSPEGRLGLIPHEGGVRLLPGADLSGQEGSLTVIWQVNMRDDRNQMPTSPISWRAVASDAQYALKESETELSIGGIPYVLRISPEGVLHVAARQVSAVNLRVQGGTMVLRPLVTAGRAHIILDAPTPLAFNGVSDGRRTAGNVAFERQTDGSVRWVLEASCGGDGAGRAIGAEAQEVRIGENAARLRVHDTGMLVVETDFTVQRGMGYDYLRRDDSAVAIVSPQTAGGTLHFVIDGDGERVLIEGGEPTGPAQGPAISWRVGARLTSWRGESPGGGTDTIISGGSEPEWGTTVLVDGIYVGMRPRGQNLLVFPPELVVTREGRGGEVRGETIRVKAWSEGSIAHLAQDDHGRVRIQSSWPKDSADSSALRLSRIVTGGGIKWSLAIPAEGHKFLFVDVPAEFGPVPPLEAALGGRTVRLSVDGEGRLVATYDDPPAQVTP